MIIFRTAALSAVVFFLAACGKPVPPEKAAMIGEWRSSNMYLVISQDGAMNYKRVEGARSTEINAPIKEYAGNSFEVGIGPASTTFNVNVPPHKDGEVWKMTVDGVELVRADD